jgi:putative colanic acid biosynthesis acetyltransferase WcaF
MGHNKLDTDGYKRPVFSKLNKFKRLIWNITWFVLCRWTPNPLFGWRTFILRIFGAKIGKQNFIYPTCKIWAPWLLLTEDVVTIGPNAEIYNPGGIIIKHHAVISQDAYICGASHDYNSVDFTFFSKEIIIESYVWLCAKSILLPGVHCHEGSVLGAGSVQGKDMAAWSVYAGNPAILIKDRNRFDI